MGPLVPWWLYVTSAVSGGLFALGLGLLAWPYLMHGDGDWGEDDD